MNFREGLGLVLTVGGAILVPLGWILSKEILIIGVCLIVGGPLLFYTKRVAKREQESEKEGLWGTSIDRAVPGTLSSYSGRSFGDNTDSTSSSEGNGD